MNEYTVLVVWMWHGTNEVHRVKPAQLCHFVHHKSHADWPGIKPGPPWWEASDWLHEPQHSHHDYEQQESVWQKKNIILMQTKP
jgi:hypothetical protein